MSAKLRPVLDTLPAYIPGRTVPGAAKLASNETPYPPLPYVVERIAASAATINRYPDSGAAELTATLAAKYGVAPEQVKVGCGSVSLCTQLVQAVADAGDEVLYSWRSFEAYPIIIAVSGAASVQVPNTTTHEHDLDAMVEHITGKTRLIFVCNPNNPTGTAIRRDDLIAFLRRVPDDVVVALDEAYREFVTDPDVPDGLTLLGDFPNLVVLRTFSKAYGLAGLRVGYAIAADPAVARAIGQTQVPFSISTVSQAAALASLEPDAERQLLARVNGIATERRRMLTSLGELGYEVPASQANFVWFPLGEETMAWADALASQGLIVRPFADSGARVTVSSAAENDRFLVSAAILR